jgi:hypothetical protein
MLISKPVNFNGLYSISSFGRLKKNSYYQKTNGKLASERIIISSPSKYRKFSRKNKKIRANLSIHRLVGIHFIENPFNKPQINHLDLDKWNNHVSNLEWATQSENNKHAVENNQCWQLGLKHVSYSDRQYIKEHFSKIEREVLASKFNITLEQVYTIGTNRDSRFKKIIKIGNGELRKKKRHTEPIYKPIINMDTGKIYNSKELSQLTGISQRYISRMLNGERKNSIPQYRYV